MVATLMQVHQGRRAMLPVGLRHVLFMFAFALAGLTCVVARAEPVASTDGETPGTKIDIQELKRVSGGAVMLRFSVTNGGEKPIGHATFRGDEYQSTDGVYLIDLAGKKKYEVVRDTDKHCICSRGVNDIAPKATVNLWAKFPAPPDGVEKVGVVFPHFIPLDDVPLAR
jgi:hypothetical protein